jgi:hypothetical protein
MSPGVELEPLRGLAGRWSGTARISWPGRDPFELTHTESVHVIGDRSLVTIEGNSYRDGGTVPVFTAFAVAYNGPNGVYWQAFRAGDSLQVPLDLGPGYYGWTAPDEVGSVDYRAEFDDHEWTERGTMIVDGIPLEVFAMTLSRSS